MRPTAAESPRAPARHTAVRTGDSRTAISPPPRARFTEVAGRWAPVALWMTVMFIASGDEFSARHTGSWLAALLHVVVGDLDPDTFDTVHATVRKGAHLVEYAILGVLMLRAVGWRTGPTTRSAVLSIVLVAAWAISDETHQLFVATRTASALDVLIDAVGAAAGVIVAGWWRRTSRNATPASRRRPLDDPSP